MTGIITTMKTVKITRTSYYPQCVIGSLEICDDEKIIFTCYTLELPWLDNQCSVSCIPAGEYGLNYRVSQHYGKHFIVTPTPGRDSILIHSGNTYQHTRGCILVGLTIGDINSDGIPDVLDSRVAMDKLREHLGTDPHKLIIT